MEEAGPVTTDGVPTSGSVPYIHINLAQRQTSVFLLQENVCVLRFIILLH